MSALSSLWMASREPLRRDSRDALSRAFASLPAPFRGPRQFLGRQYAGCGATIGAMPRCDFACRGCYLGEGANRIPALPIDAIEQQLDELRAWLGHGGNVQLTDGEVALRPFHEVTRLIRYARRIGLVPMLMTHGEGIRRSPDLLDRWMTEAGLTEISIHIDTTQRGRRDPAYRRAIPEKDLHPLRDEFAQLIRGARRRTGLPLAAATTVTVSQENLPEVAEIVGWVARNADAFKMVSFQPLAPVGRTEADLEGVSPDALWQEMASGLQGRQTSFEALASSFGAMGHPDCSRFVQGFVLSVPGEPPTFHPLVRLDDPVDGARLSRLLDAIGGLTFRLDDPYTSWLRGLSIGLRQAPVWLREGAPLVSSLLRRVFGPHPWIELMRTVRRGGARSLPEFGESPFHGACGTPQRARQGTL